MVALHHHITLYYITLHFITLHNTTSRKHSCLSLTRLLHITLHYTALHCITFHYILFHCIKPHPEALIHHFPHLIPLHYILLWMLICYFLSGSSLLEIDCSYGKYDVQSGFASVRLTTALQASTTQTVQTLSMPHQCPTFPILLRPHRYYASPTLFHNESTIF